MLSHEKSREHTEYRQLGDQVKALRQKRNQDIQARMEEYKKNVSELKSKRHELKVKLFQKGVCEQIGEMGTSKNKRVLLIPDEWTYMGKFCSEPLASMCFMGRRVRKATLHITYCVDSELVARVCLNDFPSCSALDHAPFSNSSAQTRFNSLWEFHRPTSNSSKEGVWIAENIQLIGSLPVINSYSKLRPTCVEGLIECDKYCMLVPTVKTIIRWIKRGVTNLSCSYDSQKRPLYEGERAPLLLPRGSWTFSVPLCAVYSFDCNDHEESGKRTKNES